MSSCDWKYSLVLGNLTAVISLSTFCISWDLGTQNSQRIQCLLSRDINTFPLTPLFRLSLRFPWVFTFRYPGVLRRACFRKKNNFLPYCSFVNKVKGTHLNTSKLRKKLYVIKNAKKYWEQCWWHIFFLQ